MDLAVLSLVDASLTKITGRWSELVEFLRTLLESRNSLLDPVRHDHLLFDNEDFSKSREYFWAINCLAEFEASVSANIEQWEEFRRYLGVPGEDMTKLNANPSSTDQTRGLRELLESTEASCTRLRRYQRFFQTKRTATLALRDGVCIPTYSKNFYCLKGRLAVLIQLFFLFTALQRQLRHGKQSLNPPR